MHRIYLAFLCFFRVLYGRPLPEEVAPALPAGPGGEPRRQLPAADAARAVKPATPAGDGTLGALQLLALLQREGRLVDFLEEDIDGYDDATVGAAVRDIHRGCRKVLEEHFRVQPVVDGEENETITVSDSDPARIRLTGNVAGKPPWRGVLKHHGWRAERVSLPVVTDGADISVVAPAEVELP